MASKCAAAATAYDFFEQLVANPGVYMCACVCAFVCVCANMCVSVCACVCVSVSKAALMSLNSWWPTLVYMCVYVCVCVCVRVCA